MSDYERRQEQRFAVRVPAFISSSDDDSLEIAAITENLGESGVLLRSASWMPNGSRVLVRVLLPSGPQLKGRGTVVRVEPKIPSSHFVIAVACDMPFQPFPLL